MYFPCFSQLHLENLVKLMHRRVVSQGGSVTSLQSFSMRKLRGIPWPYEPLTQRREVGLRSECLLRRVTKVKNLLLPIRESRSPALLCRLRNRTAFHKLLIKFPNLYHTAIPLLTLLFLLTGLVN